MHNIGRNLQEGQVNMLRIRLRRIGAKKKPQYRLVVADVTAPRDGAFVEIASAGTVFNLIPQIANPQQMTLPPKPVFDPRTNWQLDLRIDTRLDLRIDAMLDTQIDGTSPTYNTVR